jgi:hypothetical protein
MLNILYPSLLMYVGLQKTLVGMQGCLQPARDLVVKMQGHSQPEGGGMVQKQLLERWPSLNTSLRVMGTDASR